MVRTGRDLLMKFKPLSVYTCSDEFTLSFLPPHEKSVHLFAGRVQKIVSQTAGYTSARFNYHILNENYENDPNVIDFFYYL